MRAAQRWCEANDPRSTPLAVLELAASDAATRLERDLDAGELDRLLRSVIDQHEQDAAQEAIASARREADDRAREEYLKKRAADYRLMTIDNPGPRR